MVFASLPFGFAVGGDGRKGARSTSFPAAGARNCGGTVFASRNRRQILGTSPRITTGVCPAPAAGFASRASSASPPGRSAAALPGGEGACRRIAARGISGNKGRTGRTG